jgi:hypothetical protein
MNTLDLLIIFIVAAFYSMLNEAIVQKLVCGEKCKNSYIPWEPNFKPSKEEEERVLQEYKKQNAQKFYHSLIINTIVIISSIFILTKNVNNTIPLGVVLGAFISLFINSYVSWRDISLNERIGVGAMALLGISGSYYYLIGKK